MSDVKSTSDIRETLQKVIEAGPPTEPTPERPGALMQTMVAYVKEYKEKNKRDPTTEECLLLLVNLLDRKQWAQDIASWKQAERIYKQHTSALIARPRFVLPGDIIKPGGSK